MELKVMKKGISPLRKRAYRVVLDIGKLYIEYQMGEDRWLRVICDREFLTADEAVDNVCEREVRESKSA